MTGARVPAETDRGSGDACALRLMLSYVEAECLRIGATDAARHAAMAAALVPGEAAPPAVLPSPMPLPGAQDAARPCRAPRSRGVRLH